MVRTQMYLDEDIYTDLTRLAAREERSMAEIARDILKEGLAKRKQTDASGKTLLSAVAALKLTRGGDPCLSEHIDQYLYPCPPQNDTG